jgi:hypothetical protein
MIARSDTQSSKSWTAVMNNIVMPAATNDQLVAEHHKGRW